MRCTLPILCVLLSVHAAASDLRGVSHRSPCGDISRIELTSGATKVDSSGEDRGFYLFRFESAGNSGYATYSCSNGIVESQLVVFSAHSRKEAEIIFQDQLLMLNNRFGHPCFDWRNITLLQRAILWLRGAYNSDFFNMVEWKLDTDVLVMLSLDRPHSGKDYWSVVSSISEGVSIFYLNRDGTKTPVKYSEACQD